MPTETTASEKHEYCRSNRWVLVIDGIESYLVKEVLGPCLVAGELTSEVVIGFHNPVVCSLTAELHGWLTDGKSRPALIKHLDEVGNVVESWHFEAVPTSMWFSKLDYSVRDPLVTYFAVSAMDFRVSYPEP